MFNDIDSETTRRLAEANSILRLIQREQTLKLNELDTKVLKGLFFILLYGTLEFVITSCVKRCISILNTKNNNINEFRHSLLSLILHNECNAIADSRDKKWKKRYELFIKLDQSSKVNNINDTLFPCSTGNIKYQQLESIWNIFGIKTDIINDPKIQGFLEELVEHRNAIAHGRELASTIGKRVSFNDLEMRYNILSAYYSYITATFEEYIKNNNHLKPIKNHYSKT